MILDTARLLLFPALMAFAAASDLFTMTIPNALSIVLLVAFAILAAAGGLVLETVLLNVAACLVVLLLTFVLFALGWIGGGDAKLAAATALWLGFDALPEYLFLAAIAGGALTLAILVLRHFPLPRFALGWGWLLRMHDRTSGVPYGIALAAAALVVYPNTQIWTAALGA
jgi:prepilin peptidase CpaA